MRKFNYQQSMGLFSLFHASDNFFDRALQYGRSTSGQDICDAFSAGEYRLVRSTLHPLEPLEPQLSTVFFESQNLDECWNQDHPCRSTCVGDVIRIGSHYVVVAPEGFEFLPPGIENPFEDRRPFIPPRLG